jgi:PAS domain S-box-containing protein
VIASELKSKDLVWLEDVLREVVNATGATAAELTIQDPASSPLATARWPRAEKRPLGQETHYPFVGPQNSASGTLTLFNLTVPLVAGVQSIIQTILDVMARAFEAEQLAHRREVDRIRLSAAVADNEQRFRILADTMPQIVWSTLPDGYHDYYNRRWYEFTGMPEGSTDGEAWNGMFHPDDQDRAWSRWRQSLATGEPYEIEYRLRHANGEYRWTLGRAMPMRDDTGCIVRWFGTCTDIHEQKLLLEQRQLISQELSHRIKNIFSIVAGLVSLAGRRHPSTSPALTDLRERILALGRAHDYVRPHSPESAPSNRPATLQGLLSELLEPYRTDRMERIVVTGKDFPIDDQSTTPLALIFHELATNAAKYGGLSLDIGTVTIEIDRVEDTCICVWREKNGPRVDHPPETLGFGSSLLELSVARQLSGRFDNAWNEDGLTATIRIPLKSLHRKTLN